MLFELDSSSCTFPTSCGLGAAHALVIHMKVLDITLNP